MKNLIKSICFTFVLLTVLVSGCAPPPPAPTPVPPTFTASPIPPTNTPEPTATSTLVPPSPTPTEPPGPTPSGKFEFFDVNLEQAGKDMVLVSFGYQLEQDLDLDGVMIMASAAKQGTICDSGSFKLFSKSYMVSEPVSELIEGDESAAISMTEAGKCNFKGFTLMVFRVEGSSPVRLYEQDFEIPFELEK